jgi:hypothetical protein
MIPSLNEICTCCGGYESQPVLQLFDDKCFRIVEGKDVHGEFCLKDFAFPADGYSCVSQNVDIDGGEIVLFDNQLGSFSPSAVLESGKSYARGLLVRIVYPTYDEDGEALTFTQKTVKAVIENSETLIPSEFPIYDLFTIFTNPKSNKVEDLINKIKIVNPNLKYKVRVNALVLYGQAE